MISASSSDLCAACWSSLSSFCGHRVASVQCDPTTAQQQPETQKAARFVPCKQLSAQPARPHDSAALCALPLAGCPHRLRARCPREHLRAAELDTEQLCAHGLAERKVRVLELAKVPRERNRCRGPGQRNAPNGKNSLADSSIRLAGDGLAGGGELSASESSVSLVASHKLTMSIS